MFTPTKNGQTWQMFFLNFILFIYLLRFIVIYYIDIFTLIVIQIQSERIIYYVIKLEYEEL